MSTPSGNKTFEALFGEKKAQLDQLQANLASVLPSFPGFSGGKYLDMAIGIDFETTLVPPCPIFPVPHIGLVFDIFAIIMNAIASALPKPPESIDKGLNGGGATVESVAVYLVNMMKPSVKVHGQWVCNAGTPVLHLPGFLLHLLPLAKPFSSSELWMGSSTVLADGGPFSTQFHPALSCNLAGFPSLFRVNKLPRIKFPLLLPTSMLLCIFAGNQRVMAGGPPTIDLFQLLLKLGLKGLAKVRKGAGKANKAVIDRIPSKHPKLKATLNAINCKVFGEPVDAATGKVVAENTDFELPGPLPLQWTRYYYSNVEVNGPLGYNWHHNYNMGLYDMDNGYMTLRLADGRETVFPKVPIGEVYYNRIEQLFFQRDAQGFFVTDAEKLAYRFEGPPNAEGYTMLSSVSNVSGFNIRFIYDLRGCLKRIIDSSKRVLDVENDASGRIIKISTKTTDREILFIRYGYDAAGNLIQTGDVIGAEKHFEYEGHLLVKLTNQSGMRFYWEYEGKGDDAKCIHTWGDGGILEYWATYEKGKTTTRNSLGYTSAYFYDEHFLIYKIIDENGGVTRQSYNEYQELDVVVNPEGGTIQYQYNHYGKLTRITNENGEDSGVQYDDRQNVKSVVSFGGDVTTFFYDDQNRITAKRKTDGRFVEFEYEGAYLKQVKDQQKRTIHFGYDVQHNVTSLEHSNGLKEQWSYDILGHLVRYRDARGNETLYQNDDAGNMIYLKEPDRNEHYFSYDTSCNLIEAKDHNHRVQFEYGPLGVLRKRTQNNRTVQFNYDTELQLKSIANEGGELYKFALDGLGNVVNEWGFDGLQRRYLRDANGRVTKVLRPGERWTSYDYDSAGHIVKEAHSDGSLAAYKYNTDGLLVEAFNETSHIRLQRDRFGRVTKEIQDGYEVLSQYSKDGNRVHIGSSLGATISLEYDRNDRVSRMEACSTSLFSGESRGETWNAVFQRDATGLELHRALTGNVSVKTECDRLGRVTRRSIGAHNAEQSRTRYDWGMGNKLNRMVNELTKSNTLFDYDAFDNLASATYENKNGTPETMYRVPDKIGNLFKTRDRSDRKYSKGGRLQEDNNYVYHYDGEGNIIFKEFKNNENSAAIVHTEYAKAQGIDFKRSGTGWIYEWAGNGLLKKVINPGGREIEFYYDPLGRRSAKIVLDQHARFFEESKGKITRWVWDGNIPLHEWSYEGEYPPKKIIDEEGIKEESEPVENLVTWLYESDSFVPCAKILDKEQYSIITDYLGTPTHAYNSTGEKVWERELDIYGAVKKETGTKGLIPQLYQGQYVDEETGLAYNRFRYYDCESGNYISQDPIRLTGNNPTLYGYVKDTNGWIDVFGLISSADINWKGFSSAKDANGRTGLQRHYDKHAKEFEKNITQNEYLKKAKSFGNQTGGKIKEGSVGNFIVKFNPETGELFVGHIKVRQIRTYHIDDGRDEDPFEAAMERARRISKCDG